MEIQRINTVIRVISLGTSHVFAKFHENPSTSCCYISSPTRKCQPQALVRDSLNSVVFIHLGTQKTKCQNSTTIQQLIWYFSLVELPIMAQDYFSLLLTWLFKLLKGKDCGKWSLHFPRAQKDFFKLLKFVLITVQNAKTRHKWWINAANPHI